MDFKHIDVEQLVGELKRSAEHGKESIDRALERAEKELREAVAARRELLDLDSRLARDATALHVKTFTRPRGMGRFQIELRGPTEFGGVDNVYLDLPEGQSNRVRVLVAIFDVQSGELEGKGGMR